VAHILSNLFIFAGWLILFALALVGLLALVLSVMPDPSERQRAIPRGFTPVPKVAPCPTPEKPRGFLGFLSSLTKAKERYTTERVTQIQAQRAHAEMTAADQLRRAEGRP